MGWLERWWSKRGARARARERAVASARALLEEGRVREAFAEIERALIADTEALELMHVGAVVLRRDGQVETAELFDRAADAPADPQPLVELGSHLLSRDAPALAAALLERALSFAPFDAVIRSELALAHARRGRPDRVVATLALHPCLADDAGALFEFAWASLLTGDLAAAEAASHELPTSPQTTSLRRTLDNAIARARVGTSVPPDARDYFFIEHASLLLDAAGPFGGRYDAIELDDARIVGLVARAAWALRELMPPPYRVVALEESELGLARALARGLGARETLAGSERLTDAILCVRDAVSLERIDRARIEAPRVIVVCLAMDFARPAPRVPEIVGVFARDPRWPAEPKLRDPMPETDAGLIRFVRDRRTLFAPNGPRVRVAYVPDAPLPWPETPAR